jgi:hypothetical protein
VITQGRDPVVVTDDGKVNLLLTVSCIFTLTVVTFAFCKKKQCGLFAATVSLYKVNIHIIFLFIGPWLLETNVYPGSC